MSNSDRVAACLMFMIVALLLSISPSGTVGKDQGVESKDNNDVEKLVDDLVADLMGIETALISPEDWEEKYERAHTRLVRMGENAHKYIIAAYNKRKDGPNFSDHIAIIEVLMKNNGKHLVPFYISTLDDSSVAGVTANLLVNLADADALRNLIQVASSEKTDREARIRILDRILNVVVDIRKPLLDQRTKSEIRKGLLPLLTHDDAILAINAAVVLAKIGDDKAVPVLKKFIGSKTQKEAVRCEALVGLEEAQSQTAMEIARKLLKDDSPMVRHFSITILRRKKDPQLGIYASSLLDDINYGVRLRALWALQETNYTEAIPRLKKMAERIDNESLVWTIGCTLCNLGDRYGLELLLRYMEKESLTKHGVGEWYRDKFNAYTDNKFTEFADMKEWYETYKEALVWDATEKHFRWLN